MTGSLKRILVANNYPRANPRFSALFTIAFTQLFRLSHLNSLADAVAPMIEDLISNGNVVMVRKGAALNDVYPSPGQRPMVDNDLLIRPRDLPALQKSSLPMASRLCVRPMNRNGEIRLHSSRLWNSHSPNCRADGE